MSVATPEPTRRSAWIPWAFVGFFVVVLVVNSIMVTIAFTSWTGVETEEAYIQGLQYNDRLQEAETQRALGWTVDVSFAQSGPAAGALEVRAADQWGNALTHAAVRADFVRPTQEGVDFTVAVPPASHGYAAMVDFPLPGVWDLELLIEHRGRPYRFEERIFLRP